jgi:hypothetical protein
MALIKQFKIPLLLFLLGILFSVIGAWMKIMHYSYADFLLTAAMIVKAIAVIFSIYILVKDKG